MSSSSLDYLELCRLCLVKDRVQAPIFEEDGDVNQIFLKIHACLPVKVSRDDKLPKKICDDCLYNVNAFYQFWNTTANAEKQLLQWLGEVEGLEDKQGYVTEVLDSNVMKQEHGSDNRLDGSVMQVSGHQNMDINMIENMSIITMPAGSEHQFTTVPIDTGGTVQTVQVSGPSTQTAHDQTGVTHLQEVEVDDDEDNMDDGCDNDDGLPVKEETDEGERSLEQTYVSLPCDEAGPSGLQQQKISEMSEITIQQTADGDPKTGEKSRRPSSRKCAIRIKTALELLDPYDDIPEKRRKPTPKKNVTSKGTDPPVNVVDIVDETPVTIKEEPVDLVDEKLYRRVKGGFRCLICRDKFTHRYKVNYHIKIKHCPAKQYQCDKCPKSYRSKYLYNMHMVQHLENSSDFMYFCDKCDYRTRSKHYLKTHEIRKHTNEAKFECHHCGKRFKIKCDLKSHIDTHSSISFMCDICGGMYKSQDALNKHRRVKHLNEYKFRCDVCRQKLISRETFEAHMKNHQQPYGCDECELKFIKRSYLTRHKQRVHREQKTHACPVCERKFMCRSTMRVHYLTHGRLKPYQCTVCGSNFTQRSSMMLHWKRKHPEETEPPPPVMLTNFFDTLKVQVNEHIDNGGETGRSRRSRNKDE